MRLPVPEPTIRPYLMAVTCLFVIAAVAGCFAPETEREKLVAVFRAFVSPVRELPSDRLFLFILVQNTRAAFIAMVSGVVLGLLPIVFAAANGFVLGVVWRESSQALPAASIALRILPHGVFELPALVITAAYGLWLGMTALRRMRGDESIRIGTSVKHALRQYLRVVLPLLIVAAVIEAFVVARVM